MQTVQNGKDDGRKSEKSERRDRRVLTFILGVIVGILLLLALRGCCCRCGNGGDAVINPGDVPGAGIVFDADAEEGGLTHRSEDEIQAELNEKVKQGMINISMNTNPVFEDGTSKGNLLIVNGERNNYPQVVYIVRKDTREEIYRSGAIPVGSKIESAKLAVDLDAGTYDCVAYFSNVNMETGDYLGTAGAEIRITVLS